MELKGVFQVEPMCILDWKVKVLPNKSIVRTWHGRYNMPCERNTHGYFNI